MRTNRNIIFICCIFLILFLFAGKTKADIFPEGASISFYSNYAVPLNEIFMEEYMGGYSVGLEVTKPLTMDDINILSYFVMLQFANFPVKEKSDYGSNDPFQVLSGGIGLCMAPYVSDNIRFYLEGGLSFSQSNHYYTVSQYVNNRLVDKKQLGSESIFLGFVSSVGLGFPFVDIKAQFMLGGKGVIYFGIGLGLCYLFE